MRQNHSCPDAVAHIKGGSAAPCLRGTARFYQRRGYVLVVVEVSGLPKTNDSGFFALHIHEGGSCRGEGFSCTLGHYDPCGTPHPRHAGDLPPLLCCGGGAFMALRTGRFRVRDIIGRTLVIHSGPDDFHSQPAGNAGEKIACGAICRSR